MRPALVLPLRGALLASCALGALACSGRGDLELLELRAVEPTVLEPGDTLRVIGDGFAPGRPCQLQLTGTLHRAGRPPRPVDVTLGGVAGSAEEVAMRLSGEHFDALGPHGSFQGRLRLAFPTELGRGWVTGATEVTLDLVDAREHRLAAQHRLERDAVALLDTIGLELEAEEVAFTGLTVRYARDGSLAERAGLRRGDVIVRSAAVGVHALGDLVPPPGTRTLSLAVQRPPSKRALELSLSLGGPGDGALDRRQTELAALATLLLLVVLLLAPWPSLPQWLSRCRSRLQAAPKPGVGLWGAPLRRHEAAGGVLSRLQRAAERAALPLIASLAGMLSVLIAPGQQLHSLSAYLGFAAMTLAATVLWGAGALRERLRAAGAVAGRMAVLTTVLACACALFGTRSLEGVVAAQGFAPWDWALVEQPALLVAFPLYVTHGGLAQAPLAGAQSVVGALSVLGRVLTCALGAVVFLGGWQVPAYVIAELAPPALVGAAAFVGKVWLLAFLVRLARRLQLGAAHAVRTAGLGTLAVVGLTWAELSYPVASKLLRGLGPVVVTAGTVALVVSLVWVLRSPHPMGRGPLHPAAKL